MKRQAGEDQRLYYRHPVGARGGRFSSASAQSHFFYGWRTKRCIRKLTQYADGSVSDPNGGVFIPAERHKALYAGLAVPRRPNAAKPPAGKPALERKIDGLPPLGPATGTDDETIRNRLRMLKAVDEGVGQMLRALEMTGQLDNTVVIFTSDEGYFFGEARG